MLAAVSLMACDSGGDGSDGPAGTAGTSSSGGSGGSSGSGGSGGSSGGSGGSTSGPSVDMIDDMEDGDGSILASSGRVGAWYTANDASGTQTPAEGGDFTMSAIDPPRNGSSFAANSSGSDFTGWGALLGFDLSNDGSAEKAPYNAAGYRGISFWARAGEGSTKQLRVKLPDSNTSPEGGVCDDTIDEGETACFDDFGASVTLSRDWQQYNLEFDALAQEGYGLQADSVQTDAIYSIQFQVGAGDAFDIWIDDVGFLE